MDQIEQEISCPYVGRGGLKLRHALDEFGLDVTGWRCADFGCNIGGFTDCLLQAGASHVYAVDTSYGTLNYGLRTNPRVTVMERSNAMHIPPPPPDDRCRLVTIDLGWTPQRLAIPSALKWLREGVEGHIVSLIKPHYEAAAANRKHLLMSGVLDESIAEEIVQEVAGALPDLGVEVCGLTRSPIQGGAKGRPAGHGNVEWLAHLRPAR